MIVKIGASIYCLSREMKSGRRTPEQCIQWLAENGAEAVELVPINMDFDADPGLADRLREAGANAGVPLDNFSLGANFLQISDNEYRQELARVKAYIDICHRIGVPSIRVDCSSFQRLPETNTIETFVVELPVVVAAYQELSDYAKQYGITVLLENHGFYVNGSDRVRQVVAGVGRDNFGLQMDAGNFICVDEDCEVAVKKTIALAKTVHLKDFYIRRKDPGHAAEFDHPSWFRSVHGRYLRGSILGQGDLDLYEIIRMIKESGYNKTIFLEYEGMEDCYYATKVSMDNIRRIYNLV